MEKDMDKTMKQPVKEMTMEEIVSGYYRDLEIIQDYILDLVNHPESMDSKSYAILLNDPDNGLRQISLASQRELFNMAMFFIENICKNSSLMIKMTLASFLQDTLKDLMKDIKKEIGTME